MEQSKQERLKISNELLDSFLVGVKNQVSNASLMLKWTSICNIISQSENQETAETDMERRKYWVALERLSFKLQETGRVRWNPR